MRKFIYAFLVAVLVFSMAGILPAPTPAAAAATTWYVDADNPSPPGDGTAGAPFLTIQEAIDVALEGDIILVAPGTYNEELYITKSVTIQSTDGWKDTIVDGTGFTHEVVHVAGFAGTLLFDGFTLQKGTFDGFSIEALDFTASVTVQNCFIWDNGEGDDIGTGVRCGRIDPEATLNILDNIITDNTTDLDQNNGIYFVPQQIIEGTVNIQGNVIGAWFGTGPNEEAGAYDDYAGNRDDGIVVNDRLGMRSTMTIDDNIITGNGSQEGSDGIHINQVQSAPGGPPANPDRGLFILNNIIGGWVFPCATDNYTDNWTAPGNAYDGIEIEQIMPATFTKIEGNVISANGDQGIEFGADGGVLEGTVKVLNNIIGAWTFYWPGWPTPTDNVTFMGNGSDGIWFDSNIGWMANVLVEGNAIGGNGAQNSDGILVDGVYGVLNILNNQIGTWTDDNGTEHMGNAYDGIEIEEVNCDGDHNAVVTIGDNTIAGNGDEGIEFGSLGCGSGPDFSCAKHVTVFVEDNLIDDNGSDGIRFASCVAQFAIVSVSQNTISDHDGDSGINIDNCDANGIEIVCNIIEDNEHGIFVRGGWHNINRNEITGNVGAVAESGIHLTSCVHDVEIQYNRITENSAQIEPGIYSYGIFQEEGAPHPVNAINNWWGNSSGPGGAGPGTGDWVNDLVVFSPWLTTIPTSCFEGEAVAPAITKLEASPWMVSLWCDGMFFDELGPDGGFSVGPTGFTVFTVEATDAGSGVAKVTMNWKDLLIDDEEVTGAQVIDGLIPADKLQKFLDQLDDLPPDQQGPAKDEWQRFLDELEVLPFKHLTQQGDPYHNIPEVDCWYFDQKNINWLLEDVFDFFDEWLDWSDDEEYVIIGEIVGQELNLGKFNIKATVTDFKGNFTTGTIPLYIVDFQMPVCEGWNLRSTWLTLENSKWKDIIATMQAPANADSILRWSNQYQRWEYYALSAGVGKWFYAGQPVTDALMVPQDAYWIHSLHDDEFGLITERGITAPPARQMYAGWNLVSADINWEHTYMPAELFFISIYNGAQNTTGYTQVLSVDQYNEFCEDYYICNTLKYEYPDFQQDDCCGYAKWFYQDTWVFTRPSATQMNFLQDPCYLACLSVCQGDPLCALECYSIECQDGMSSEAYVTRGGGYWVFNENPAVLAGWNSTPLPSDFWFEWWDGAEDCWFGPEGGVCFPCPEAGCLEP